MGMRRHFGVQKVLHVFIEVVATINCHQIKNLYILLHVEYLQHNAFRMYYLETECITRLQPIHNLQRKSHKYFCNLTNAQYTPFLSQGACHSKAHCIRTLSNVSSSHVHSCSGIPSRLQVRSGTNMELPDTASQEVTCWGIWEIWRPLFQKQVNLLNVSNPYTRK